MHDSNNLPDALHRLSAAARNLATALAELSTVLNKALEQPYREAGCPFGRSQAGMEVWRAYGQHTTVN